MAKKAKHSYTPTQSAPVNGNGVMDLVKELWQAAVNLRGSIEPADYKRYVLPIIFLRRRHEKSPEHCGGAVRKITHPFLLPREFWFRDSS